MEEKLKEQPLVSIIIPFYNHADWLEESIQSVIAQTYQNYEIILINDGSQEDVQFILNEYGKKIRYYETKNQGAASARNLGLQKVNGDYVAFLDSDDLWEKEKLMKQIKAIVIKNGDWCITSFCSFDSFSNKTLGEKNVSNLNNNSFIKLICSCPIATPSVLFKYEIIKKLNLQFEEKFKVAEDSCFWITLSQEFKLIVIDEALVKVRMHGNNASMNIQNQIEARCNIYEYLITNKMIKDERITFIVKLLYQFCIKIKKIKLESLSNIFFFPVKLIFYILFRLYY